MKDMGYWKYFIKISGCYIERVHKRYKNSLFGDSPEFARGLDSKGGLSIAFHVALTYKLSKDNPKKFQMGTPKEVMRVMIRCWDVEPTNKRVLQGIESLEFALDKIIEARGCLVRGIALRHSHCLQRIDGEHEVTTRVSNN